MNASRARALKLVLVHEGAFSDRPRDPGGATMRGVTQRVYDGYRQRRGQATRSVKLLTNIELQEIYAQLYWNKIDGDELPAGLDYCVFDVAVNSGVYRAAKLLQHALNDVLGARALVVDGNIGPATLKAAESVQIPEAIDALCDRRMVFLRGLKTLWPTFGDGWTNRVEGEEQANGTRKGGVRQDAKKF